MECPFEETVFAINSLFDDLSKGSSRSPGTPQTSSNEIFHFLVIVGFKDWPFKIS